MELFIKFFDYACCYFSLTSIGPHREMAVDCPDNFIARNKTPPRYPPPRPPQVTLVKGSVTNKSKKSSLSRKAHTLPHHNAHSTLSHSSYTTTLTQAYPHNTMKDIQTLSSTIITTTITTLTTNIVSPTSYSLSSSSSSLHKPLCLENSNNGSNQNSPLLPTKFHYNASCNNTLPKCTAKLMQSNTKLIINNYNSDYQHHPHHNQHQKHHQHHQYNKFTTTPSLYTTCSMGELNDKLNDTHEQLQMQNAYNAQQQLKLDQIENYENCMELQMEQQKLNNALTMSKGKMAVAHNPNGGGSLTSPEDLDLMMVDALYRKGSSSHSSSYESEVLSKKSSESFDSISYRQLQNNNNDLNSKETHLNSNSTSSSSSSSNHKNGTLNGNGLNGGVGSLLSNAAMVINGGVHNSGSGDSLPSITSSGSTPPPEYELKELSSKNSILPPVVKHRELPVDVPDSFIEMVKTPPRYPPPAHLSSLSSQISSCSSASTANTTLTRINSTNNSNTEFHNMSLSPQSLKPYNLHQETSLISTMSLNGSFEDFQQQQLQQQASSYPQQGSQIPQPQVAALMTPTRADEVCVNQFKTQFLKLAIWLFYVLY